MWRVQKNALLLIVSASFYLVFIFDVLYGERTLGIPIWVHIVCPLLLLFLVFIYVQEWSQWKGWVRFIDSYNLRMDQNVGLWGTGTIRISGEYRTRGLVIDLEELDSESDHREYCRIRLMIPCPKREKVIELRGLDILKERLESLYGLQIPLFDDDVASPGSTWKQKSFSTALVDRGEYNRKKRSRINWTNEHLLIVIEEESPQATTVSSIIDVLHIIIQECEDRSI
jgi:hypothetical protein